MYILKLSGVGMILIFLALSANAIGTAQAQLITVCPEGCDFTSIQAAIAAKCRELGTEPLAIGGLSDHVHLLVRFPTSLALAKLIQEVKGASSHLVTHKLKPGEFFKWQGGYGAFTVSKEAVPRVAAYVRDQKKHHTERTLQAVLERTESEEPGP